MRGTRSAALARTVSPSDRLFAGVRAQETVSSSDRLFAGTRSAALARTALSSDRLFAGVHTQETVSSSGRLLAGVRTHYTDAEGRSWLREYKQHTQLLHYHNQHHVHILNVEGQRGPLTHCRCNDNPQLCKSDFPRTKWLIDRAVILCQGLARRMGMAITGTSSKLGALHGPMNHESLNGTHPAMLAAQCCNSDVQLP